MLAGPISAPLRVSPGCPFQPASADWDFFMLSAPSPLRFESRQDVLSKPASADWGSEPVRERVT